MQRKILTFKNSKGEVEDLIPYVDAQSIQIGGTNLEDYLAQIEDNIERALLYLGAYESEQALLLKHPNGSDLKEGSYAIVTDEDALYIYDTDGKRWLKTASATLGILKLNDLSPINGSLTITGGDIKATVSNADVSTQTITNHLDTLYAKNNDINDEITNIQKLAESSIAFARGTNGFEDIGDSIVYKITVDSKYKDFGFIYFSMNSIPESTTLDKNKFITLQITYTDGDVVKKSLYSGNNKRFTLNQMYAHLNSGTETTRIIVSVTTSYVNAINVRFHQHLPIIKTRNLNTNQWQNNEEGTGYKIITHIPESQSSAPSSVISVSKSIAGKYTTAIVDYSISNNVITLYSDTKFDGVLVYAYYME